jgi:plastocyanin
MQIGPTRLRPAVVALAGVLATTVVLGACGSDEDGGPSASEADVTVLAEDSLQFDQTSYSAPAGEVVIAYEDAGNAPHTLLIEGVDGFKLQVTSEGDTDVGTADLEPGEYRLYCDVPGHESMEATLTVE